MPIAIARRVVVVLGSGRSGTSLLMQVLSALGMALSRELIAGREDNPDGFFEDAGIVRIQADLLRSLNAWPFHPLPPDWLDAPATAAAFGELQGLLRERLRQNAGTWGFKDPRTAAFLPLWQRLFASENASPAFVLALREPGKIIQSFMRAYGTTAETAEQVWLSRTCDALRHTAADCFIVHYEDWFSDTGELADRLAEYTGLGVTMEKLQAIIKPGLNRSRCPEFALCNEASRRLDAALRECRSNDFDRNELLSTVAACRSALAGT